MNPLEITAAILMAVGGGGMLFMLAQADMAWRRRNRALASQMYPPVTMADHLAAAPHWWFYIGKSWAACDVWSVTFGAGKNWQAKDEGELLYRLKVELYWAPDRGNALVVVGPFAADASSWTGMENDWQLADVYVIRPYRLHLRWSFLR